MASFEDFFAREYEELESENERLRDKLDRMREREDESGD